MHMRASLTLCFLCCGSSANSCRGSQRVFVGKALICIYMCVCAHCLFFHLPAGPVLFPGCRCCSKITSCLLPPLFAYPWTPAISCQQGRGNYRKQDEHPGQEGSERAGRCGRRRLMTLEIRKRTIDTYQGFFSFYGVDIEDFLRISRDGQLSFFRVRLGLQGF